MARRAREVLPPARKPGFEQVAHAPADEIARQRLVGVGVVLDPRQAAGGGVGANLSARHVEQRSQENLAAERPDSWHAARPFQSSAAQQIEQHGLRLVAEVMAERDRIRSCLEHGCAARFTRRRLKAIAFSFYFYLERLEWNPKVTAIARAEFLPVSRVGAQAVIDVNRRELVAETTRILVEYMQQDDGIDSARQTDDDAFSAEL